VADPIILWFRSDLRLADNPALTAAAESGKPIIALYVLDGAKDWAIGGAARWWLAHSLRALARDLGRHRVPLTLRRGEPAVIVGRIAAETGAREIHWNRCYDGRSITRDKALKAELKRRGVEVRSHNASLLAEPWDIAGKTGQPYGKFTPFWRQLRTLSPPMPLPSPDRLVSAGKIPSDRLEDWRLEPASPNWAQCFDDVWQPGEAGAGERLRQFLDEALSAYASGRDRPDRQGTSGLSPHLHWGEISPRQIWHAAIAARQAGANDAAVESFLAELGWREFSHHLLYHHPDLPDRPLRPAFEAFPWSPDRRLLRAWQRGLTGYPIVDAGMRALWATGWMHNRVRMVTASFLTKHLLQPWQDGEAWFWDCLVDADLASNAANWQWVAGCGADAAPYFRIFNPTLQGRKFDPDGGYVRQWVPELRAFPSEFIHEPWRAPDRFRKLAMDECGRVYPDPIVDHRTARASALHAYATLRHRGGGEAG